jgi:magnesium-transporting ATPase (P-type)
MPLSIPLLVTVVLLAGALIMVKSNVIIRNLNSIESAGRISVICTDKTGTITQNKMTVKWVYTPNKELDERLYCVTSQDSIFEGKIVEIKIGQDFNKAVLTSSTEYQESSPVKVEKESSVEYLFAGGFA